MGFDTNTGAENHIHYGDNVDWDNNAAMSWACHFFPNSLTASEKLMMKGDGTATTSPWQLYYTTGGLIRLRVADGAASTIVDSTTGITLSEDNTIVVIWNSSTVRFIINGTDDGTSALVEAMAADANNLHLCGIAGTTASADGVLSHVMIWNTELTLAEAETYRLGGVPDPAGLVFWQPCYALAAKDYIKGASPTTTGTVAIVETTIVRPPRLTHGNRAAINAVTALLKVLDEVENLAETHPEFLGLIKVLDEVLDLVENQVEFLGIVQLINEILDILDGDNNNVWDPAGNITETMSDGTVWTTVYPPFIKRTQWT